MAKRGWALLFVNQNPRGGLRHLSVSSLALTLMLAVMLGGGFGLARAIYFFATYGYARLGVYAEHKKNHDLLVSVRFLEKLSSQQQNKINELVNFEDQIRLKFGMTHLDQDIRRAGIGGRPNLGELVRLSLEDPVVVHLDSIKTNLNTLLRQSQMEDSTVSQVESHVSLKIGQWQQSPSLTPVHGRITSPFGIRVHPFTGEPLLHEGVDIANNIGTPVFAPADGIISYVGEEGYFGKLVIIQHPRSGYKTMYGHLEKAKVSFGQQIKRGALIGYLGNSGRTTGPHLHYQISRWDKLVNPLNCILPEDVIID
ncbi:MAG: M23 family metallopeptidase [Chitinivibrionales bacterium]|nr:M23 family metallopeptidase [Chitinivibrionales bacterium]